MLHTTCAINHIHQPNPGCSLHRGRLKISLSASTTSITHAAACVLPHTCCLTPPCPHPRALQRSHAEAYRRVVALASAQMNMVARVAYMAATPSATATGPTTSATATGESDMRGMFPVVLELSTAWAKQAAHAVHGMSGMEACKQWEPPPQQSLLGGMLPDPFDLVARDLRTVLWCWRVNKGAQGRNSKALASFACGVLGQEGTERWGLSDVSDQKDSPIMLVTAAVLHGQKLPPPSGPTAAGLAALDCLAALAVDAEGEGMLYLLCGAALSHCRLLHAYPQHILCTVSSLELWCLTAWHAVSITCCTWAEAAAAHALHNWPSRAPACRAAGLYSVSASKRMASVVSLPGIATPHATLNCCVGPGRRCPGGASVHCQ